MTLLVMCVAWTGKHDSCKISGELWSKVDITWFQYIILFNKAKQTFSSVVCVILQCKKTHILEPNPGRCRSGTKPNAGSHRTRYARMHWYCQWRNQGFGRFWKWCYSPRQHGIGELLLYQQNSLNLMFNFSDCDSDFMPDEHKTLSTDDIIILQ